MLQSVPPCGEGVNLISTSIDVPQTSITQTSVHGVFERPVPAVTRESRTRAFLHLVGAARLINAAVVAP